MESGYPLNNSMSGGLTALILASSDKKFFKMCERIIETGGDLNKCTNDGQSAITQAMKGNNIKVAKLLLKNGARVFYYGKKEYWENSPFFQAITNRCHWAIEMFCDHGADMNEQLETS